MRNGTTRRGKQNDKCCDCGRHFVAPPVETPGSGQHCALDRLRCEKLPLAIVCVLKLSASWLQGYVNQGYKGVPRPVQVTPKPKGALRVQREAWWSFVEAKGNQQWVWLALDVSTRERVGGYLGERSQDSAVALWPAMPAVYRQCAMVDTDPGAADKAV